MTLVLDEAVPSKRKSARPKKSAAVPEVRQATIEELKEIEKGEAQMPEEHKITAEKSKVKLDRPGFVRRIFNRKAV